MILPMARVELVGPWSVFPSALRFLQARGVLELRTPPAQAPLRAVPPADADEAARLQDALRRIDALVARLPPGRGQDVEPLPPPGTEAFSERIAALAEAAAALEQRRAVLVREREATARFARLVVALAPFGQRVVPAGEPEVRGILLRDGGATVALLEAEVREITGGRYDLKARPLGGETTGVLLTVPRECGREIAALLAERGVEERTLPSAYAGKRLVDVLLLLASRERALPGEIARADAALAAFAEKAGASLAAARHAAAGALERASATRRCARTRFAFVISGFMPAERLPALREEAARLLGPEVTISSRSPAEGEWSAVPVVLRNASAIRPFQRLLALVPLPRYGSVDPTAWLAIFFPLFFGLVLGDLAFGLLGIAVTLVVRKARWAGPTGRDLATIALWCSASAACFGLLFGEALGGLGAQLGLAPLLVDRRRALLPLLGIAVGVGAVHVALGIALGLGRAVRRRRAREAIARAGRLLLLASAAAVAATLLGALPRGALLPAVLLGASSIPVSILAEGPLAALDLVLTVGSVLSYARLMALGLASVMLAEVANLLAARVEPAAVGIALGVLLHALNYTFGLVSPTIAALRLQYVEFFDKFYDEGGAPYHPFSATG